MNVVICETGKRARQAEIVNDDNLDDKLEALQKLVQGYIEVFCPFEDPTICIVCNEDGKISSALTPNRPLYDRKGSLCDILYGTIVVCGKVLNKDGEEDLVSLTDEQVQVVMERLGSAPLFIVDQNTGEMCTVPWN